MGQHCHYWQLYTHVRKNLNKLKDLKYSYIELAGIWPKLMPQSEQRIVPENIQLWIFRINMNWKDLLFKRVILNIFFYYDYLMLNVKRSNLIRVTFEFFIFSCYLGIPNEYHRFPTVYVGKTNFLLKIGKSEPSLGMLEILKHRAALSNIKFNCAVIFFEKNVFVLCVCFQIHFLTDHYGNLSQNWLKCSKIVLIYWTSCGVLTEF